jgi:hypothetical protein
MYGLLLRGTYVSVECVTMLLKCLELNEVSVTPAAPVEACAISPREQDNNRQCMDPEATRSCCFAMGANRVLQPAAIIAQSTPAKASTWSSGPSSGKPSLPTQFASAYTPTTTYLFTGMMSVWTVFVYFGMILIILCILGTRVLQIMTC